MRLTRRGSFGVLPALAFPTLAQAVSYLAAYGVGTVLAMMGFAALNPSREEKSSRRDFLA